MDSKLKRASVVFIMKDGLILSCSRKDDYDDYGLPGGKCEEGESFEDAAARELYEETGLRAYDFKLVFERRDKDFIVKTFMPSKFYGNILSEEDQDKKKEGRVKWLAPSELIKGSFGIYNLNLMKKLGII